MSLHLLTFFLLSPLAPFSSQIAPPPRLDAFGDALPPRAIARLGTVRFRTQAPARAVWITSDGKTLVSQCEDAVRTWDASTGKPLLTFPYQSDPNDPVASSISPDGALIALPSDKRHLNRIINLASGNVIREFGDPRRKDATVAFSPDGKTIATLYLPRNDSEPDTNEQLIRFWNAKTGAPEPSWKFPITADLSSHRLYWATPHFLLTAAPDEVQVWNVREHRLQCEINLTGRSPLVAFSPEGAMLATIVNHEWIPMSYIRVVDIATGEDKQLLPIASTMSLDSERFCEESRERIFFAPDGKRIFVRDAADVLTAVDISSGRVLWRNALDELPAEFAVLPDGSALAVAQHPTIRLIDAATGKERVREPELGHQRPVQDAVFSSDGRFAATACRQRIIRWDLASGRHLPPLQNPPAYVNAPKLSGDGRSIVALSDSTLRSWDFHTGKSLRRVSVTVTDNHSFPPKLLSVSHDGTTVAIGDCRSPFYRDPTDLLLVDTATGKTLASVEINGHLATSSNGGFSADGNMFRFWSTYDDLLNRWQFTRNPKTGAFELSQRKSKVNPTTDPPDREKSLAELLRAEVDRIAVSPDERHLLYKQVPGTWSIYSTATGAELKTQDVHFPSNTLTVFSPDGRTIARADFNDGSLHIIERATFIERQHIATPQRKIHALNFSPDGKRLITANDDSTALIWDLVGALSHRPGRTLSPKDLAARWTDLASNDGTRVQHAIDDLAASPNEAVPFLVARLQSVLFFDEKAVTRLIADLDAESFEVRDSANHKLAALEFQPVHLYRKALAASPSPETRRRLTALIDAQGKLWRSPTPGHLRLLRSLEILELIATPDARRLLESLANGDPSSWLTLEAAGSVERLRRCSP